MKKIITMLSVLTLTACGGITRITPESQDSIENLLPVIHPDGGQLCVCRTSNYAGSGLVPILEANGEYIGRLPNNSFFCVNLMPDDYAITSDCWNCARVGAETTIRQGERKFMELFLGFNGKNIHRTSREMGLSCIAGRM